MTNLGQPGSRSISKKADEARKFQFLANQKIHTRQVDKSLKNSQSPGLPVLQEIKGKIKADHKWIKIPVFQILIRGFCIENQEPCLKHSQPTT